MSGIIFGRDTIVSRSGMGFVQKLSSDVLLDPSESLIEDCSESHVLVVAPTGAGKGRNFIIPNLLHYDGPAIVVDIKGEAAAVTANYRRNKLGHKVVVIDPWGKSGQQQSGFNPLDYLKFDPENLEDNALSLASMISGRNLSNIREPFWDERARSLVSGLLADHATASDIADRSMQHLWQTANAIEDSIMFHRRIESETIHPFARSQYVSYANVSADVTRCGIHATAMSHMSAFVGQAARQATADTGFALEDIIAGEKLTIYLVFPPSKLESHAALLRMWLTALIGLITERRVRPRKPTLLMIDELAHIGPLSAIKQAVTLARGYGLRCALFVQSYAQLAAMFKDDHTTILENCGSICTFGHKSIGKCQDISRALGDITARELCDLSGDRLAVSGLAPETLVAKRIDYLTDPMFEGRFAANPFFEEWTSPARQQQGGRGRQ